MVWHLALQHLTYLLFTLPLTWAQVTSPCTRGHLFDFENVNEANCFQSNPAGSGTVTLSSDQKTVKQGQKSLKWHANGASTLRLYAASTFTLPNRWLSRGGVKVWLYKENTSPGKTLTVEFKNTVQRTTTSLAQRTTTTLARFQVNLDFQGWRGIWVTFSECKLTSTSFSSGAEINDVNFVLSETNTIHIDLLEFLQSVSTQSRDKIVPPVSPFGLELYDASNFWQRTYYWSQQTPPALPTTIDPKKIQSLEVIRSRLRNWYCDETKASPNFQGTSDIKKRWGSLLKSIKNAHSEYQALTFDGNKVIGPPLFCRDCRNGKKFGFIMETILLPLALEYHLRSRTVEIDSTVTDQLVNLNSAQQSTKNNAYETIAGEQKDMQNTFKSYLPSTPTLTSEQVKTAINSLNVHRLNKINNLLDYVKQQGFADGSGLGSLDHELNKDGAGFMHALFLLSVSPSPPSKSRLLDLISTAKWYNDFGEVYQSPTFEIKGTTADRMITLLIFRLMIVLLMPKDTDAEKKAKIRDMDAVLRWINNALAVNEGLGGVIKPDFTGHHHKAFYGSAYVPQALHNAALVHYLLGGTEFALSTTSVTNIRRGLETLRLIAVKYSTPNSVNGRFPNYVKKVLIKAALAGYAYISVEHPSVLPSVTPTGITITNCNVKGTEMFLRLYDESDPDVKNYLKDGRIRKSKYYFNSLGSLDIMKAVVSTATSKSISAEPSPEGHWSKNFAVLSVHRRKEWAASCKGFNRFIWDYENKAHKENIYGMFASHGALLIANSESLLGVHDVQNGWDWAKVPGATTIALGDPNLNDLNINKHRHYNQKDLAGGLTFKGTGSLENGIFGMDFKQPNYGLTDWRGNIDLEFKKSVFFFENLLVCLGSHITAQNTNRKIIQTTLFQDKLVSGVSSSFIKVNNVKKTYADTFPVETPTAAARRYTSLTDAKGNFYYIPSASRSILKVHVQDQNSKTDDGETSTTGRYGTAWFHHGAAPSNSDYEYAVLIPTKSYHTTLADLATAQETRGNKVYRVLQKDSTAHVVKFLKSPKSWTSLNNPIIGYVMFARATSLPGAGPITRVGRGNCLIMAEETSEHIFLSISIPSLNLRTATDPLTTSDDVEQEELFHSSSEEKNVVVTLRNKVQRSIVSVQTHGEPDCYKPNVWIVENKKVRFLNLKNGFSVEVKLKKKPT